MAGRDDRRAKGDQEGGKEVEPERLSRDCGQYFLDIQVRSAYTSPVKRQCLIKKTETVGSGMRFNDAVLQKLASLSPANNIERAELANLLLEERVSDDRLVNYEAHVAAKSPSHWDPWREAHERYVVHFVRGGNGKDPATFQPGESALFAPEANQFVLRLEELNTVLVKEGLLENDRNSALVEEAAVRINTWIVEWKKGQASAARETRVHSLADLGKLTGRNIALTSGGARLETLTEALNAQRRARRPSFIAFDAEFPGIDADKHWLEYFCQRCGLAHHYAGYPIIL